MRVLALLDGTIVDHRSPLLRPDDLGVVRGDGIFETILVVRGKAREVGPHLDRLERSGRMMEMTLPAREEWERGVTAVIDNWPWETHPEMALKLVCTRGIDEGDGTPTAYAMGSPVGEDTYRKRTDGVAAITLERGYSPEIVDRAPWLLLGAKTLSYAVNMAAMREARSRGADEVVFTATDGTVLEGPTATVIIGHGKTLTTPPPHLGILPGTTQGAVFRAAEKAGWTTRVASFPVEDLYRADSVWVTSSVRAITQVHTLDGVSLRTDPRLHSELVDVYEAEY